MGEPTPWSLFLVFTRIGLTSFGGGLSGWLLREFVQRRHWLDEEQFLSGLALAQSFPGVNVVNMAIWIGFRLCGTLGALAGVFGIIGPPAVGVILIATAYGALSRFPIAHLLLTGVGAAAIGLSLSMGITAGRRALRGPGPAAIMAVTFVAVGLLGIPLPWVVLVMGSLSVGLAYRRLARA